MSFLHPEYFWLLVFLLVLFIFKNIRDFRFTVLGYMLTYVLIVLALSRPVIVQEPVKSEQILSDVIIAVDLSYSMQASDIEPTRLGYAKNILAQLVKSEQQSRFGVLGFTTNAIVLSPLTQDSELLLHLFNSLDDKLIVTKGSSVMPALVLARKMSKSQMPSLVILSDGGDETDYTKEALYAKENSMVVNVFMIATQIGGTLTLENGKLLSDEQGNIVVSRANENISSIAKLTGGVYTRDFGTLQDALDSQRNKDFKSLSSVVKNLELFYYCVLLAIISFLVSVTSLKRFILSFLLFFGINLDASVLEYVYEKIDTNKVTFNLACGYYKNGEYEKALIYFERVKSSDAKFKSDVFYNTANTYIRLKEFKKAKEAYLKSLTLSYSKEADENLFFIKDVQEQKTMTSGQQKTNNKSPIAKQEESSAKKKDGGSSNLQVSASASSGAGEMGKKTKSESMLNLNSAKAKLSSTQYELINKRGLDEKKPW